MRTVALAVLGGVIFPGLLYCAETRHHKLLGLLMKAVSSLTFVLLGFTALQVSPVPEAAKLFVIGEIFGAIGDVVINLGPFFEGSLLPFCGGGAAFLTGHIFFISMILRADPGVLPLGLVLAAAVFLPVIFLLLKWTETARVMRILTSLYMLTVSSFFAFTLAAFLRTPSLGRGILSFGALVFLFGDFDLMLQTMGKKKWKFVFPCMYVYYPAQIVLALALYLFK